MYKKDNFTNIYETVFYDEVNEHLRHLIRSLIFKVYLYSYQKTGENKFYLNVYVRNNYYCEDV